MFAATFRWCCYASRSRRTTTPTCRCWSASMWWAVPAHSGSLWTKMNWSVRSSERPWSRTRVKVGFQFLVVITRNSCSTTPPPLALMFWVFRIQLDPKELVALHYARSHLRLSHNHQSATSDSATTTSPPPPAAVSDHKESGSLIKGWTVDQ